MTREHIVRLMAGSLVLSGLGLGWWVNSYFYLITAFVGLNLVQSAITKCCLAEDILKKLGLGK